MICKWCGVSKTRHTGSQWEIGERLYAMHPKLALVNSNPAIFKDCVRRFAPMQLTDLVQDPFESFGEDDDDISARNSFMNISVMRRLTDMPFWEYQTWQSPNGTSLTIGIGRLRILVKFIKQCNCGWRGFRIIKHFKSIKYPLAHWRISA